jgi:hypothetical protein
MPTLFDKFQIPDRYTIGGQEYTVIKKEVVRDEDDDPVFGLHSPAEAKITIAENFPVTDTLKHPFSKDQMVNSFFHEMFHSFNFMMNTEQDETIAQSFANFMCEFLKTAEYDSGHERESGPGFRPFSEED